VTTDRLPQKKGPWSGAFVVLLPVGLACLFAAVSKNCNAFAGAGLALGRLAREHVRCSGPA
jgi:hypothetical protein